MAELSLFFQKIDEKIGKKNCLAAEFYFSNALLRERVRIVCYENVKKVD